MATPVHDVHDLRDGRHWVRHDLAPGLHVSVHDDGRIHVHVHGHYRVIQPLCGQGVDLIPEGD